jgi:hypothetical protein
MPWNRNFRADFHVGDEPVWIDAYFDHSTQSVLGLVQSRIRADKADLRISSWDNRNIRSRTLGGRWPAIACAGRTGKVLVLLGTTNGAGAELRLIPSFDTDECSLVSSFAPAPGDPIPLPKLDWSGAADSVVAVLVNGTAYLVDVSTGSVHNLGHAANLTFALGRVFVLRWSGEIEAVDLFNGWKVRQIVNLGKFQIEHRIFLCSRDGKFVIARRLPNWRDRFSAAFAMTPPAGGLAVINVNTRSISDFEVDAPKGGRLLIARL